MGHPRGDGTRVEVRGDTIVSVRPAPGPRRKPRAGEIRAEQLERITAAGWQPIERILLGDWALRASEGFTGRANSVLPLGDPDRPLDAALGHVESFYRSRGLPAKFQVPLPLKADLDADLAARGWRKENITFVMTADIDEVLTKTTGRAVTQPVAFDDTPSEAWLAVYSYRGDAIPAIAKDVMTNTSHPVFASIASSDSEDPLVAVTRGALTGSWLGVTALDVDKQHRLKGLATFILDALLRHARERGCRFVYLQVAEENVNAKGMYDRIGFSVHHRYQYRVKP